MGRPVALVEGWVPPGARSVEVAVVALPARPGPVTYSQYQNLLALRLERLIRQYPDVRSAEREVERAFWDRLGREFHRDRLATSSVRVVRVVGSVDVETLLWQQVGVRPERFPSGSTRATS